MSEDKVTAERMAASVGHKSSKGVPGSAGGMATARKTRVSREQHEQTPQNKIAINVLRQIRSMAKVVIDEMLYGQETISLDVTTLSMALTELSRSIKCPS